MLVVEDDGPGIPAELAAAACSSGSSAAGATAAEGSGLGLAIVRAVAESHGGTVELETPAERRRGRASSSGSRRAHVAPARPLAEPAENGAAQTSTTTGRTIGRRRSRS